MSSSISSFKNLAKIGFGLILAFVMLEIFCQLFLAQNSTDLKEINSIKETRARLHRTESNVKAIILGNSLTREGLDLAELKKEFSPGAIEAVALNGALIGEWEWIAEQHFCGEDHPTYVIINANGRALGDESKARTYRLARIARPGFNFRVPFCLKWDVEEIGEYQIGRLFLAFSWRARIGDILKERVIPSYREGVARTNRAGGRSTKVNRSTYRNLASLIGKANRHGIKVIVVAMPTKETYELSEDFFALMDSTTSQFVDFRALDVDPNHFVDDIHLSSEGRKWFTPEYSKELIETVGRLERRDAE